MPSTFNKRAKMRARQTHSSRSLTSSGTTGRACLPRSPADPFSWSETNDFGSYAGRVSNGDEQSEKKGAQCTTGITLCAPLGRLQPLAGRTIRPPRLQLAR
jgi:hypothetical protein